MSTPGNFGENGMIANSIVRRTVLATGAASAFGLAQGPAAAQAPGKAQNANTTKAASWILGDKMSLAAIAYGRGLDQATVDKLLDDAKQIAQMLGVTVSPLPPKDANNSKTLATLIQYLIKGDGWATGTAILNKYDNAHATLFEVSVKSNLLLLLYAPGDDSGIGAIIKARCESIGLPRSLWSNLVNLIQRKATYDQVKDEVFKLHKDVASHFLNA